MALAPLSSSSPMPTVTRDRALAVPQTTADVQRARELLRTSNKIFRSASAGHGGYVGDASLQKAAKVGNKFWPQGYWQGGLRVLASVGYGAGGAFAGLISSAMIYGGSAPVSGALIALGAGATTAIPATSVALKKLAARQQRKAAFSYIPGKDVQPLSSLAKTDSERAVMAAIADTMRSEADEKKALSPSAMTILTDISAGAKELGSAQLQRGEAFVNIARILDAKNQVDDNTVSWLEYHINRVPEAERAELARVVTEVLENTKERVTYAGVHALADLPRRVAVAASTAA